MPTPTGVGILPVNLDEQTRDVAVQVVREVDACSIKRFDGSSAWRIREE